MQTRCVHSEQLLFKVIGRRGSPIIEAIHSRDEAFDDAYTSKDPDLLAEAKRQRTATKKAIHNARSSFVQAKSQDNCGNPWKLWFEINKLIKTPKKTTSFDLLNSDNCPIPQEQIPTHINSYFATIGPTLAKKFASNSDPTPETLDQVLPPLQS